jgi:hypothetical protein
MRRRLLHLAIAVLLGGLVAGCAGPGNELLDRATGEVEDGLERARDTVERLSDDARFCLAVTRTISAIESGSPDTAEEAAAEVVAQAPEGLAEPAREVVDELRRAIGDGTDLRSE